MTAGVVLWCAHRGQHPGRVMGALLWRFGVRLILAGVAANANRELPFDHVHAKVGRPGTSPGSISRTAIINRLRASQSFPLVTLVAPAGSGKTTILSQWADGDERPSPGSRSTT